MNILPELSDIICRLLRATGREGVEALIAQLRSNGYFRASCHRHHYYVGGMAQHALEVFLYMREHNPGMPMDKLTIVALLHDLCDIAGFHQFSGHGRRSVALLEEFGFPFDDEERRLIRYHMFRVNATTLQQRDEVKVTHNSQEWQIFKNADCHSARHPLSAEETLDAIETLKQEIEEKRLFTT